MAKKSFKDLTEREILALAIQLEEEDSRVYGDFAEGLRESYPATAKVFEEMQAEESRHRQRLIEMHQQRFGDHIPLIRRQDVKKGYKVYSTDIFRGNPKNATPQFLGAKVGYVIADKICGLDIDDEIDLDIVSYLVEHRRSLVDAYLP